MNCKGLKNLLGLSFYLSSIKLKRQTLMFWNQLKGLVSKKYL